MELSPENSSTCEIMHLGEQSNPYGYFIAGTKLTVIKCGRDLGVFLSADGN